MNSENTHIKSDGRQVSFSVRSGRALVLLGAVAAMAITVACSSNSNPVVSSSRPAVSPSVRPAVLQTTEPAAPHVAPAVANVTPPEKPPASTLYLFRSRDYGVSFHYPWQYAYLSAKSVANGDSSLQPRSDGHDGQFTLARIEIPKGFYPDTDFESGYFSLSLNQDLDQQQCESVLPLGPDGTVGTDTVTIHGVDFRWMETDSGGRGSALKLRNYVTFTNGICYELEMGVKTSNEDGLARELDPDQVMRRLDAILRTVTILPATRNAAAPQVETSTAAPAPMSQN